MLIIWPIGSIGNHLGGALLSGCCQLGYHQASKKQQFLVPKTLTQIHDLGTYEGLQEVTKVKQPPLQMIKPQRDRVPLPKASFSLWL